MTDVNDFALSPPSALEGALTASGKESRSARTRRLAAERLSKMHLRYGRDADHKCADCHHLRRLRYANTYLKCEVYGITGSEASDWRAKWTACGKFEAKP